MTLDHAAFAEFFDAVHRTEGGPAVVPYPWQKRLANQVLDASWPDAIHIPTGLGKTGAITVAVFAMAIRADAPTRLIYVVDRRTVVDAAYDHAVVIQERLRTAKPGSVLAEVAARLTERAGLFGEVLDFGTPLFVSRLRGGEPRDEDWYRSPVTPTVVVGTVDQIGSRLLHRGYGERTRVWPIQAGLIGMDSLLLLDEPHLSVPFLQTLDSVRDFQPHPADTRVQPLKTVVLGATLPQRTELARAALSLDEADRQDPATRRHLDVRKPLVLALGKKDTVETLVNGAIEAGARRVAVMANTVDKARSAWASLLKKHDVELVIGRSRPADRAEVEARLRTLCGPEAPAARPDDAPVIVVATQTLEVGADLSFDTVISEAAPWPSLVQRAGRLLRRAEDHPGSFIVIPAPDPHPAYGDATKHTLAALSAWCQEAPSDAEMGFHGIEAAQEANRFGPECYPEVVDAPVMLREHVSTWSRTSPVPPQDIAVAPFLHGVGDRADDVRIIWREGLRELLRPSKQQEVDLWTDEAVGVDVLPCRAAEAVEVPVHAARAFLRGVRDTLPISDDLTQKDTVTTQAEGVRKDFLVQTDQGWSRSLSAVRPGATVLVDTAAGGLLPRAQLSDETTAGYAGWDPNARRSVTDRSEGLISSGLARFRVSTLASRATTELGADDDFAQKLTRIHSDLTDAWSGELSPSERRRAHDELTTRLDVLSSEVGRLLVDQKGDAIDWGVRPGGLRPGWVQEDVPGDWVLTLQARETREAEQPLPQTIEEHGSQVAALANAAARALELSARDELVHAARHHDDGKARIEWQRSIGVNDVGLEPLAKSGTQPSGWERDRARFASGVESGWRHEVLSAELLAESGNTDLVVHLAGSHHGYGRPFYLRPIAGRDEQRVTTEQADRFARLTGTLGPWGLAFHEAVLRLSDWAASGHPQSTALRKAAADLPSIAPHTARREPQSMVPVRLSALSADNLADYCTAVGLLRMLARVQPGTTIAWDGVVPVIGWPGNPPAEDPALLRTALEQLVLFRDEVKSVADPVEITGGQSGLEAAHTHALATAFGQGSEDAAAWFAGCHDEVVRQKGDPHKVAGSAAAIWTMGRTSPWAQIDTASTRFNDSKATGRRATALRETVDDINTTLLTTPGRLHLLRAPDANTYGIDFRSGSYRAKADRDAGYVPFLVALAHVGFNTLFRPRTRTTTVNGKRRRPEDPMVLDIWLHRVPLTLTGLHSALSGASLAEWFGDGTLLLQATQATTGNRATFYAQARPVSERQI